MRYHIVRRVPSEAPPPPASDDALEADWIARSSMPGTVWLHDFRNEAEVDNFRWDFGTGNDPNDLSVPNRTRHRTDDGIGAGGCLESFRPAGSQEPPEWWRMLSPLFGAGNGRGVNDPAAGGTIALQTYTPTQGGGQISNWGDRGYYGNPAYHAQDPGAFDGTDYWFSMRLKISGTRVSQPDGGKALYFTRTDMALTSQEIVLISNNVVSQLNPAANLLKMYRSGSPGLDEDDPGSERQPGNSLGLCHTSPDIDGSGCYYTPSEQWFSLMWHNTLGLNGGGDTHVELYVAHEGETSWRKVWDQPNVNLPYGANNPFGHNAIILVAWMNSIVFTQDVFHRYCQLIFSKSWHPPPQAYDTTDNALIVAAASLSPGQSTSTIGGNNGATGLTADTLATIQWVNRFFYDHERKQAIVIGKDAIGQGGERSISIYNASTNTWATSGAYDINGIDETGHVYESFAYDPKARQIYSGTWSTASPSALWVHTIGDPLTTWTTTAVSPWTLTPSNATQAVLGWHPNLFGPGDGGLVVIRVVSGSNVWLVTWRKSTDTWSTTPLVAYTAPSQHGAMVYVRHLDALIVATVGTNNTYRINAGSGGVAATPILIANTPIQCRHIGGGSSGGVLLDDPRGLSGPYILAKGTGTGSVWKYNPATDAWVEKLYVHAFPVIATGNGTNWCAAPIYPLGVFMCRSATTTTALLWRPND